MYFIMAAVKILFSNYSMAEIYDYILYDSNPDIRVLDFQDVWFKLWVENEMNKNLHLRRLKFPEFEKIYTKDSLDKTNMCPICPVATCDEILLKTECGHIFCEVCLLFTLMNTKKCPECEVNLFKCSDEEYRELSQRLTARYSTARKEVVQRDYNNNKKTDRKFVWVFGEKSYY